MGTILFPKASAMVRPSLESILVVSVIAIKTSVARLGKVDPTIHGLTVPEVWRPQQSNQLPRQGEFQSTITVNLSCSHTVE